MSYGRTRCQLDRPLVGKLGPHLIKVQNLTCVCHRNLGVDNHVVELESLVCRRPGFFKSVFGTEKAGVTKLQMGHCYAGVSTREIWIVLQRPLKVSDAITQAFFTHMWNRWRPSK